VLDLGTRMVTSQIPAHWRDVRRRPRYGRFMSKPRAIGLVLMVAGVFAYGTAPDWLAPARGSARVGGDIVRRCPLPQTCDCPTTFQLLDRSRDPAHRARPSGCDLAVQADRLRAIMRRDTAIRCGMGEIRRELLGFWPSVQSIALGDCLVDSGLLALYAPLAEGRLDLSSR
jgi:hypothetical protein